MTLLDRNTSRSGRDWFPTTHWTLVLAARNKGSKQADDALEMLCKMYWYPLYAYARRCEFSREDSEDATQSFFIQLIKRNDFNHVSSDKGKFRAFLLASFKHFLSNERDRMRALKRGGRITHIPFDSKAAESRYLSEPVDHITPDKLFDRAWALTLLEIVLSQLRKKYTAKGKGSLFDQLKIFLTTGKGTIPYAKVAIQTGMTEGAVKVAVFRLRQRYREQLKMEIAQTLHDPSQVDEELRALFAALM